MNVDDKKSMQEAVWGITNATMGGTTEQVIKLGHLGCIAGLVRALEKADELNNRVVIVALAGISNILTAGDMQDPTNNEFLPLLRECGGADLLNSDLRHHVNDDVRLKVCYYFPKKKPLTQQETDVYIGTKIV